MGIPEPYVPKKAAKDPTTWHPPGDRDYEHVEVRVSPDRVATAPLNYHSLADFDRGVLGGIELQARADLLQTMAQAGLQPDERSIRVHWTLQVEGLAWKAPEGFVHPDASDEMKREGREAWKRAIEMAHDSMGNLLFVKAWRRRRVLGAGPRTAISGPRLEITGKDGD